MNKITKRFTGLLGLLLLVGFAATLAWLLWSAAAQPAGQAAGEPTSPIVTTPQPTWTAPSERELMLTAVTPSGPLKITTTPAGSTPLPTPTFPIYPPTETPGPPTATTTPLPTRPDLITPPKSPQAMAVSGILFHTSRQKQEGLTIHAVNLDGSHERIIIPAEYRPYTAWLKSSPDGSKIVYTHYAEMEAPLTENAIYVINADGTENRILVPPATRYAADEFYPMAPFWSPDGKEIAFFRVQMLPRSEKETEIQLWRINVDSSEQKLIINFAKEPQNVLREGAPVSVFWLANGYIYFINGYLELNIVNPITGEVTKLVDNVRPWNFFISRDGHEMVTQAGVSREAIQRAGLQPVSGPDGGVWDSNLDKVAFCAYEHGDQPQKAGIWVRDSGTGQERLLVPDVDATLLEWSPDGKMLAFLTDQGIHVVDTTTGHFWLAVPDSGYLSDPPRRDVFFLDWLLVPSK